ncbi:MAG: hypothetical protein E7170_02225 [Firmicutes bacterium]|nr:hypothetical protein [Bacillota bacterium]
MNRDLKVIKNKYGEKMMHLCRELFPTILETEGALSKILLDKFEPSRYLYENIKEYKTDLEFKDYIYSLYDSKYRYELMQTEDTCEELIAKAGYDLYQCFTEDDIQSFKKYYANGEELCTFNGGRLDRCIVFFAVKKNVDEIKREDFKNPQRQDLYGTSVISIQFTRDKSHTLSIKNRYNHKVASPDATFSNNLDEIIPGLTYAFEKEYEMEQTKTDIARFELPGHVLADDGKYYPYNFEYNNIYYCPNNIIIDNFEVKRFDQEKYLIIEQFVLDLKTGEIKAYDETEKDCFPNTITNCDKVQVIKEGNTKKIIMSSIGFEDTILKINERGRILEVINPNIINIGDEFLKYSIKLKKIEMKNVKTIGNEFASLVETLDVITMSSLEIVGDYFCRYAKCKEFLDLKKLKRVGHYCLTHCENLKINLPDLEEVGDGFFEFCVANKEELCLPKLKKAGHNLFRGLITAKKIEMPNLEEVGNDFDIMYCEKIDLRKLKRAGDGFLRNYSSVGLRNIPKLDSLKYYGEDSFFMDNSLKELMLSKRKYVLKSIAQDMKKVLKTKLQRNNLIKGVENENIKSK